MTRLANADNWCWIDYTPESLLRHYGPDVPAAASALANAYGHVVLINDQWYPPATMLTEKAHAEAYRAHDILRYWVGNEVEAKQYIAKCNGRPHTSGERGDRIAEALADDMYDCEEAE